MSGALEPEQQSGQDEQEEIDADTARAIRDVLADGLGKKEDDDRRSTRG